MVKSDKSDHEGKQENGWKIDTQAEAKDQVVFVFLTHFI